MNLRNQYDKPEVLASIQEVLKGKQHKIDKNKNGKIDAHDFHLLRKTEVTKEEAETIDELSKSTLASYAKKATHDARMNMAVGKDFERVGQKTRKPEYKAGAKKWEDKYKSDARKREAGVYKAVDRLAKEEVEIEEAKDTPGQSHQCALHVKHKTMGEGKTIFSQHAEPLEDGSIAWYDVMFEHGIEKKVPTENLEILVSEAHGNHKKK